MEENIVKYVRNIFRLNKLEKETNATIKGIRNLFRIKKQNKGIKDRIIRDIRDIFEHEEDNYYKPVWVTIILNITVKVIEKHYQLKNTLR